ncbi:MAG: HEAT repeat domain-containing protein, partial [Nannocystaceae bacterium]
PICLVTATSRRDAGEGLLKFITIELLRDASLDVREVEVLLRQLLQQAHACASLGPALRGHEVLAYLRHPSPQIRKLIIACLRETQAEELSINLVRALEHADVQTIRQAIEALGAICAKWASAELAAKLDHPNMNIKKAAAQALATAGTVEAVPKLMSWLGHHDNAGFRTLIVAALKSILGSGFTATIVAAIIRASQQPGESRRVELLRTVETDAKPRIWRRLFPEQQAVGKPLRPPRAESGTSEAQQKSDLDRALAHLCELGWSQTCAEQVATAVFDGHVLPDDRVPGLASRMRLWIEMAEDSDWTGPALCVAFAIGPKNWSAGHLRLWGEHLKVLLAYLPRAGAGIRGEILRLLDTLRVQLPPQVQRVIVAVFRECAPLPSTSKQTAVARLRAFGATICRQDVEDALSGCEGSSEPWVLQSRILLQAFQVRRGRHRLRPEACKALDEAIRRESSDAIAGLRASWKEPAAATLAGLCEAYHQAASQHRDEILAWMEEIQPLDAPTWTLTADLPKRTKRG